VNAAPAGGGPGRSVRALVAGFVVTVALSLATDVVMHGTGVFPPWGEPMSDGLFAWATVYRVAFAILGGYVTARMAAHRPMAHVVWGGAIGTVVATAGAAATWNAGPSFGPRWYPVVLVLTALPCVWAGGLLFVRSRRLAAE
jgi:peptidoglycan/LPS O-acetylase OafA/YrhL